MLRDLNIPDHCQVVNAESEVNLKNCWVCGLKTKTNQNKQEKKALYSMEEMSLYFGVQ